MKLHARAFPWLALVLIACGGRTPVEGNPVDDQDAAGARSAAGGAAGSTPSMGRPRPDGGTGGAAGPVLEDSGAVIMDPDHVRPTCTSGPPAKAASDGGMPLAFQPAIYLSSDKSDAALVVIADLDGDGRGDLAAISGEAPIMPNALVVY